MSMQQRSTFIGKKNKKQKDTEVEKNPLFCIDISICFHLPRWVTFCDLCKKLIKIRLKRSNFTVLDNAFHCKKYFATPNNGMSRGNGSKKQKQAWPKSHNDGKSKMHAYTPNNKV